MVWLRGAFLLTVVACAVSTFLLWRGLSNQSDRIASVAVTNHRNLCQIEERLLTKAKRQKRDAKAFLKAHPHGIPGISAKDIRTAIRNDNADIKAATDPTC